MAFSWSILVNSTSSRTSTDVSFLKQVSGNPKQEIERMVDYLSRIGACCQGGNTNLTGGGSSIYVDLSSSNIAAATGTVTAASVTAADTVTVNGVAFTARDYSEKSPVTTAANTSSALNGLYLDVYEGAATGTPVRIWFSTAGVGTAPAVPTGGRLVNVNLVNNDADTAVATKINTAMATDVGLFSTVSSAVVTFINRTAGNVTNSDMGTSTFTLGSVTAGQALTSTDFNMSAQNADTASSLSSQLNASTNALVQGFIVATVASAVVTLTSTVVGLIGNAQTLASSNNSRLAVSGARLTGGTGGFSTAGPTVYAYGT